MHDPLSAPSQAVGVTLLSCLTFVYSTSFHHRLATMPSPGRGKVRRRGGKRWAEQAWQRREWGGRRARGAGRPLVKRGGLLLNNNRRAVSQHRAGRPRSILSGSECMYEIPISVVAGRKKNKRLADSKQ